MRLNLGSINLQKLGELLTNRFFDYELMKILICMVNSPHTYQNEIKSNNRVRSIITDMKIIGAPSVSGYALISNFSTGNQELKNAFIIKTVRDNSKSNELVHEIFCGFAGLNSLRAIIPNFAIILGYFECSGVVIKEGEEKKVSTFCNTCDLNNTTYAIYEKIDPSISFGDLVKTCDGETYMQCYFSILCSLYIANEQCDFTHYDLHDENILIRECTDSRYLTYIRENKTKSNIFYVPYEINIDGKKKIYYVANSAGIPTIIDYGRSHIKYNKKHYGMPGEDSVYYIDQNIKHDRSNIIYDAYKLLGMSLSAAYEAKNYNLLTSMGPLLKHFEMTEFDIKTISDNLDGTRNYYMLPINSTIKDIKKLLKFCIEYSKAMKWNVVKTSLPNNSFVLNPLNNTSQLILNSLDFNGKVDEFNESVLIDDPRPKNLFELYDILNYYSNIFHESKTNRDIIAMENYKNKYHNIIETFLDTDFDDITNLEINKLIVSIEKLSRNFYRNNNITSQVKNRQNFVPKFLHFIKIYYYSSNISLYFDPTILQKTKNYISYISQLANMLQDILTSVKLLKYVINTCETYQFEYEHEFNSLNITYNYFDTILKDFKNSVVEINNNFQTLINVFKNEMFENYFSSEDSSNSKYMWYFNIILILPSLFDEYLQY